MKTYTRKIIRKKPDPKFKIYPRVAGEMVAFARFCIDDMSLKGHLLHDLDYQDVFIEVKQRLNTYIANNKHEDYRTRKDNNNAKHNPKM